MEKMRTRVYTDLTNYEIEQYLKRSDVIIIPVGNAETHAGYPVDAEYVMVEGYARLLAERVDGLMLPNVVYFNPGGTQIGRGTIHMSMTESFRYTKELAYSLLNQGFKRQIWIPSHVPTSNFLLAMVTEFFDETKVPMLFLDIGAYLENVGATLSMPELFSGKKAHIASGEEVNTLDDWMIGSYKLAGRLNAIPAKGEVDFPPAPPAEGIFPNWFPEYDILGKCCRTMGAPAPFYYAHPDEHIGPPVAQFTREELEHHADIGIQYMNESLDKAQLDRLKQAFTHLQEYMEEVVGKNYDHLPKNPYSSVSPFSR